MDVTRPNFKNRCAPATLLELSEQRRNRAKTRRRRAPAGIIQKGRYATQGPQNHLTADPLKSRYRLSLACVHQPLPLALPMRPCARTAQLLSGQRLQPRRKFSADDLPLRPDGDPHADHRRLRRREFARQFPHIVGGDASQPMTESSSSGTAHVSLDRRFATGRKDQPCKLNTFGRKPCTPRAPSS